MDADLNCLSNILINCKCFQVDTGREEVTFNIEYKNAQGEEWVGETVDGSTTLQDLMRIIRNCCDDSQENSDVRAGKAIIIMKFSLGEDDSGGTDDGASSSASATARKRGEEDPERCVKQGASSINRPSVGSPEWIRAGHLTPNGEPVRYKLLVKVDDDEHQFFVDYSITYEQLIEMVKSKTGRVYEGGCLLANEFGYFYNYKSSVLFHHMKRDLVEGTAWIRVEESTKKRKCDG